VFTGIDYCMNSYFFGFAQTSKVYFVRIYILKTINSKQEVTSSTDIHKATLLARNLSPELIKVDLVIVSALITDRRKNITKRLRISKIDSRERLRTEGDGVSLMNNTSTIGKNHFLRILLALHRCSMHLAMSCPNCCT